MTYLGNWFIKAIIHTPSADISPRPWRESHILSECVNRFIIVAVVAILLFAGTASKEMPLKGLVLRPPTHTYTHTLSELEKLAY